jgi:hypothetical protein
MSDAIIGVIIGGLLTGSGTWIAMWLQHKKWKIEQKIRILENRRERIEALSSTTLEDLSKGMMNNVYSSDMMSNIEILFPDHVAKKFNDFMQKKDKTELDMKHCFYEISLEIKKALADIDKEIENLLN